MKVQELATAWDIKLSSVYTRIKKMKMSLDEIKLLSFDEINGLYIHFSKWRVSRTGAMYHVYPPHRPSFSIEFAPSCPSLKEAIKILLKIRKSHYTRREPWFTHTQYEGYNVLTHKTGKVTFYGHDFLNMFTLIKNYYKREVIEE